MRTSSFAPEGRGASITCAALLASVIALLPLFVTDVYTLNILVLTLMFAALSQSWNILSGYCGQISLGHALYSVLARMCPRSCSRSSGSSPGSAWWLAARCPLPSPWRSAIRAFGCAGTISPLRRS